MVSIGVKQDPPFPASATFATSHLEMGQERDGSAHEVIISESQLRSIVECEAEYITELDSHMEIPGER